MEVCETPQGTTSTSEPKMITKFRNERSLHGHRLDLLKSALQKYIRRGKEEKALYVASQIDMFADMGLKD